VPIPHPGIAHKQSLSRIFVELGLSVPKRLRYHLERDPAVLNVALHIFLTAIERVVRQHSPAASAVSVSAPWSSSTALMRS